MTSGFRSPEYEAKQAEKSRLASHYRREKKAQWRAICEQEPRILELQRDITAMRSPAEILGYLRSSWVMESPADMRFYALRIVNAHAEKMSGRVLDDPIPPAENLFIAARKLLAVR